MNKEFLQAIFGQYADQAHVTDFIHDPSNIPADQHLKAWKGDHFSRYQFQPVSNQYFTISTFATDEKGVARRRKALYLRTHCIVLDDVKEKLAMEQVQKLPRPSWILETSPGSEQWGYILTQPATDRHRVENLLDGLVANGLAPEGRDPGMKGVTRYVRLPDGVNNKASKLVNGQPFQCRLLMWEPFNTTTLEALALPFAVNLDAERRETRVDGAANVAGHPLLEVPDLVRIKEVRSDGRFDITCPWVDEHTGADDSGTAVFTNADGSIGFKCHHGACQGRTGRDLLALIEQQEPGFGARLSQWKTMRVLADVSEVSFLGNQTEQEPQQGDPLQQLFDVIRRERHDSPEARELVVELLKIVDELPTIDQVGWHKDICQVMYWNKSEFKDILKDLRTSWYTKSKAEISFFDETIFIAEANQFYDRRKRIFYSAEAYQNTYSHLDPDARKEALLGGRVTKVDKLDYAPKMPPVFEEKGVRYGNAWCNTSEEQGVEGDCSRWLEHFNVLGWGPQRKHLLQWMAYTVKFPEKKINHMLTLGSAEGCGKDFLLYPLTVALGDHAHTISGEELTEDFNDYLLSTKFLLVNETELGDRKEAMAISAKLKPLAAAPPDRLRVNQKGIKKVAVRNLLSVAMTTNSQLPFRLQGQSRRIFALWSDLNVRGRDGGMKPEWHDYWSDRWDWMKNGGAEMCVWYLRNCVDLSDFNPGTPPPMTEFLRDITEASKSTQLQTIEAFVKECAGAFASDVIMASDAVSTLKGGEMLRADLMYAPGSWFTPVKVGMLMREMHATRVRVAAGNLWIIRNHEKYEQMTGGELWQEYQNQISGVKKTTLRAVN